MLKWWNKIDVLILCKCHSDETVQTHCRGTTIQKPKTDLDYNTGKSSIHLSDQLSSSALRKTIQWYKKVTIELFLDTTILNCHNLQTNQTELQFYKLFSIFYCRRITVV